MRAGGFVFWFCQWKVNAIEMWDQQMTLVFPGEIIKFLRLVGDNAANQLTS